MYIFEGGAGCTGLARKVEPGEELDWGNSNDVNVTETKLEVSSVEPIHSTQDFKLT